MRRRALLRWSQCHSLGCCAGRPFAGRCAESSLPCCASRAEKSHQVLGCSAESQHNGCRHPRPVLPGLCADERSVVSLRRPPGILPRMARPFDAIPDGSGSDESHLASFLPDTQLEELTARMDCTLPALLLCCCCCCFVHMHANHLLVRSASSTHSSTMSSTGPRSSRSAPCSTTACRRAEPRYSRLTTISTRATRPTLPTSTSAVVIS